MKRMKVAILTKRRWIASFILYGIGIGLTFYYPSIPSLPHLHFLVMLSIIGFLLYHTYIS